MVTDPRKMTLLIGLCIKFTKMFVCENPPGGAWGVRLACSLSVPTGLANTKIAQGTIFLWAT